MSNSKIHFSEFDKTDFNNWKEKVISDLKGKDYSILEYTTDEGIQIDAIIEPKKVADSAPDQMPFTRGHKEENNEWTVFRAYDKDVSNEQLLYDLNKGISGIELNLENCDHLDQILDNVQLEYIHSAFTVANPDQACKLMGKLTGKANGWLNFNPIAKDSLIGIDEVLKYTIPRPTFKAFNIDGAKVRNQGGNIIDEIAYLLSCGNEYLNHFQYTGIEIDLVAENILFTCGVGPNYFFEIAKIRALRKLWSNIVAQYNPKKEEAYKIHIHGKTLTINIHSEDPYNNLLRQTTESMSAVIGGVDSLEVVPYEGATKEEKELFSRMAKNIQLMLKEESMLNQVIDPAGGSYYLESLTDEIAQKAWEKFQEMEANGGYMEVFDEFMHSLVAKRTDYLNDVESGKKTRVGVNKYQTEKA